MRWWFLGLCLVIVGLAASEPRQVRALEPTLSITPSIYQLDLSDGKTEPHYDIVVRNTTDQPIELTTSSLDVTGQTSSGSTVFSPAGIDTAHDIGGSMRYTPDRFELGPNASQTIRVTITAPEKLEPGGHYGAAVFTAVNDTPNGESVGVRQAVSSLLFVTTRFGGIRHIGEPSYTLPRISWRLPKSVAIIIPNTGNTQIAPSGSLQLKRHGSVIADGNVNADSNLILPGQNRLFTVGLRQFGGVQLAGRYQAELRLRATPDSVELVRSKTFIYISPLFAGGVVGLVIISLLIGRFFRRRTLHKRHRN